MVYLADSKRTALYRSDALQPLVSEELEFLIWTPELVTQMSVDPVNGHIYWATRDFLYTSKLGRFTG